jgi:hypothetical protein
MKTIERGTRIATRGPGGVSARRRGSTWDESDLALEFPSNRNSIRVR